jgi:3-oxocholest-4-en-26-oyl-CoA dehydrogenase beta subunit
MDFDLDEEQQAVRALAADIFGGRATTDRVAAVEAGDRVDEELMVELAEAGLLGIALPEEHGGAGLGPIALALVLEEQGRRVAPVPLWSAVVAANALVEHGTDEQQQIWVPPTAAGEARLTVALEEFAPADVAEPRTVATADGDRWCLTGTKAAVPVVDTAAGAIVSATAEAGPGLFLVERDAPGVTLEPVQTSSWEPAANLVLQNAPAQAVGEPGDDALGRLLDHARVALAALQIGIGEGAVRLAADYLSEREQFGRPLATFQAVAHQLADGYIDTEALRVTTWQAAWRLAAGVDPGTAPLVAKWWADDAGQRIVHRVIHLHGGMGVDTDYPAHRYLLWGKQIAATLGSPSDDLARIGRLLAQEVGA